MATFVDSELAASAGFADTINEAPGITARIAAARITLEKADHAERVLEIMGDFGADQARYAVHHPWADRLPRDAALGQARHGGDMRLAVFHYPLQGWTDAVVMNVLQGLATGVTLEELGRVSYAPLAEVFRAIAPRERRHTELGIAGLADDRRHRGRPRRGEGRDRLLAAQGRRQLRHRQLRPVRDAEALRTSPPPERGAARRLDRRGGPDAGTPRPRLRTSDDRRCHDQAPPARKLRRRRMGARHRQGRDTAQRRDRRARGPDRFLRRRLRRRPRLRPRDRRSEAAEALIPRARGHAEGPGPEADGAQGGVLRREPRHRRHPHRWLDRHRGRHRHACCPMPPRPAASCRTAAC